MTDRLYNGKPFKRTHTMERLPMTPLERLGEALETCIVACAGRRNSERAQAVLDVIREQGWTLTPPADFKCIVDGKDPCPKVCLRQGYCTWLPPGEEK